MRVSPIQTQYFDRRGRRIDFDQWIQHVEDPHYRRLVTTKLGEVTVTTSWTGLWVQSSDYADQAPLIFETFVSGGELHCEGDRYETEADALKGHYGFVARIQGHAVAARLDGAA